MLSKKMDEEVHTCKRFSYRLSGAGRNYNHIPNHDDGYFYELFQKQYNIYFVRKMCLSSIKKGTFNNTVFDCLCDYMMLCQDNNIRNNNNLRRELKKKMPIIITKKFMLEQVWPKLLNVYPYRHFIKELVKNPQYHHVAQQQLDRLLKSEAIYGMILDAIPEKFVDIYPLARAMDRHFILHVGGTNTGKTYEALQRMEEAEYGIYLAPLRLLAHEVFSKVNSDGVLCHMLTGEEEIHIPGAKHQSSTIEMLSLEEHYDVAVIDEAQMISDSDRGGAWTEAIAGVLADEIHVCMSQDALELVKEIIISCSDTYEIVWHQRITKLIEDSGYFVFPDNVKKGDALIVFSKKSVLDVAAELQENKIKCSVIYGALPYEVRENEVDKFNKGETDVVVSTDAIGMGMNLPIRRIVFLESEKYDGKTRRPLNRSEIKQIAGRAGRRGIYEEGYWTAAFSNRLIRNEVVKELAPLEIAYIHFPRTLLDIDSPVSEIMDQWTRISDEKPYVHANVGEMQKLCRLAEKHLDDRWLIYKLACIPFNVSSDSLLQEWLYIVESVADGQVAQPLKPNIPEELSADSLEELEYVVSFCDLYMYYLRRVEGIKDVTYIRDWKVEAIDNIQHILKQQSLNRRK